MQQVLSCILLVVLERKTKFCFPRSFSLYEKHSRLRERFDSIYGPSKSTGIRHEKYYRLGFLGRRFIGTGVGVLSVSLYQGKTLTGVQIGGAGGLGDMQRPGITQRRGYRFFARR